jgi:hypothetical protein
LDATLALLEAKLQSVEGLDRLDRQAVVQSQESQLPIPTLTSATPLLDHEIDEAGSTSRSVLISSLEDLSINEYDQP